MYEPLRITGTGGFRRICVGKRYRRSLWISASVINASMLSGSGRSLPYSALLAARPKTCVCVSVCVCARVCVRGFG